MDAHRCCRFGHFAFYLDHRHGTIAIPPFLATAVIFLSSFTAVWLCLTAYIVILLLFTLSPLHLTALFCLSACFSSYSAHYTSSITVSGVDLIYYVLLFFPHYSLFCILFPATGRSTCPHSRRCNDPQGLNGIRFV